PAALRVVRCLGVSEQVTFQLCIGPSLAIIVPTNIRSFLAHRARGAVLMDVVRAWTIPAIGGVAVGATTAAFAPAAVLKLAFVVIAAALAFKLLLGRDDWRIADDLPGPVGMTAYGFVIG